MEDVLNGESDGESEDRLREHLSQCEECTNTWHAAWQVRHTLNRCEVLDPGEPYFEEATATIMARIEALQMEAPTAGGSPAISSARYGSLQIRGVGLVFFVALGFLLQAFRGPATYLPTSGRSSTGNDVERVGPPDGLDASLSLPDTHLDHHVDTDAHRLPSTRNESSNPAIRTRTIDRIVERLIACTPPPIPQMT